jgi:hypothetical protein
MLRVMAGVLLIVAVTQAGQVKGIVVDQDGKPVAGARVDHTGDNRKLHQTDVAGRFEVNWKPAFVFRKDGYLSKFIRPQDGEEVRITLEKVAGEKPFPKCSRLGRRFEIEGWMASLKFPMIPGVTATEQSRDVDYAIRYYYVETESGRVGIRHGAGPMWSSGLPLDESVWRSVSYEEISYKFDGYPILDARGRFADGRQWRYLGPVGESAGYSDLDAATAKILDKVLDGACSVSIKIH